MGFLKFLKKEKKEEELLDESLDVPPKPPSIQEELPEPPKFEENGELPEEGLPMFTVKDGKMTQTAEEGFPPLPDDFGPGIPGFPKLEETPKFVPKPPIEEPSKEAYLPKKKLAKHKKSFYEKMEETAVREEKRLLRERPTSKGPLHIRLESFRETLANISTIKSDLRKSDRLLLNLIKSKEEKDKEFEKWHGVIGDIQKKLIFIEKTLFKGD